MRAFVIALSLLLTASIPSAIAKTAWPAPKAPVVQEADGYVEIPGAAVMPKKNRTYKAVFDATREAEAPNEVIPALNMVGSELNLLAVTGVPLKNAKFVVIFRAMAMESLLDDTHYQARHHINNPNLKVIEILKKSGVVLYVCGQNLAYSNIDPASLTPDVVVASDALIALIQFQNDGYALLNY